MANLVSVTAEGLYCAAGDFHVDPWRPVPRALITPAHGDHARRGSGRYLTTLPGREVLRTRMGSDAVIETVEYGQPTEHHGVRISFHLAGVHGPGRIRGPLDNSSGGARFRSGVDFGYASALSFAPAASPNPNSHNPW